MSKENIEEAADLLKDEALEKFGAGGKVADKRYRQLFGRRKLLYKAMDYYVDLKQSNQIEDYKYLLGTFTDCPQIIIDNPGLLRGKLPTDTDVKWAYKVIESIPEPFQPSLLICQPLQSIPQQTKDAIDMMRSGLNALRSEVDSTIVDSLVYIFNKVLATQQSIPIEENVDKCPTCNAPVKVSWAGLELVENSGDETLATKCYEYIQGISAPVENGWYEERNVYIKALNDIVNWNDDMEEKWDDPGYRAIAALTRFKPIEPAPVEGKQTREEIIQCPKCGEDFKFPIRIT